MKKTWFGLLLVLLCGNIALAQQDAQVSHNMFNNMAINPGFAGSNDAICLTSILRQQWMGFKDAEGGTSPQTMILSMDAPVRFLHGGLGGTIYQDELGFEKNIGMKLGYAYRFNLGEGNLGIGANVGFLNKTIDFSKFKPIDGDDPILTDKSKASNFLTDFGFGLFYKVPSKYFVGFSMTQLTQAAQDIGSAGAAIELRRHYYLTAGYEYVLPSNPEFEIDPSLLIKSDGASIQYDFNALVRYNNKFWGGVSYRVQDAVVILLGMNYKNFRIGYAYDITTSRLASAGSSGSHEIMLGYCFKIVIEKPRKSYRNTRFL